MSGDKEMSNVMQPDAGQQEIWKSVPSQGKFLS